MPVIGGRWGWGRCGAASVPQGWLFSAVRWACWVGGDMLGRRAGHRPEGCPRSRQACRPERPTSGDARWGSVLGGGCYRGVMLACRGRGALWLCMRGGVVAGVATWAIRPPSPWCASGVWWRSRGLARLRLPVVGVCSRSLRIDSAIRARRSFRFAARKGHGWSPVIAGSARPSPAPGCGGGLDRTGGHKAPRRRCPGRRRSSWTARGHPVKPPWPRLRCALSVCRCALRVSSIRRSARHLG